MSANEPIGVAGERRVALFQAEWVLQSPTAHCALFLAQSGFQVDLFLCNCPSLIDLEDLSHNEQIQIHDLSTRRVTLVGAEADTPALMRPAVDRPPEGRPRPPSARALLYRMLRRIQLTTWLLVGNEVELLPEGITERALEEMTGRTYVCLIGIEKQGLIWAGQIARQTDIPFVYYSLELYTKDYERLRRRGSLRFKRLRAAESRHHRRSLGTIIQDNDRAEVLFRDNGVEPASATIWHVPVSLLGEPYTQRSGFLQDRLGLPDACKVLLYFGQISERRYALDLVRATRALPAEWHSGIKVTSPRCN